MQKKKKKKKNLAYASCARAVGVFHDLSINCHYIEVVLQVANGTSFLLNTTYEFSARSSFIDYRKSEYRSALVISIWVADGDDFWEPCWVLTTETNFAVSPRCNSENEPSIYNVFGEFSQLKPRDIVAERIELWDWNEHIVVIENK